MLSIRRFLLALCVSCTLAIVAAGAGWAQKLDYGHAVQAGEIMVADADYSHFPRLARGQGGRLGVLYYRGYNHGSGDNQGIARSQKPHGSGPLQLAIDGTHARGGAAELPVAGQLIISVEKDETARRFTVIGEDRDGRRVEETVAGPAAKRAYTRQRFKRVTSIAIDGAPAGPVSVGPRVVPSNMEFRYSDNGGESWSGATVLADGIGSDDTFNYVGPWPAFRWHFHGGLCSGQSRYGPHRFAAAGFHRQWRDVGQGRANPVHRRQSKDDVSPVGPDPVHAVRKACGDGLCRRGELGPRILRSRQDLGGHLIVRTPPDTDYNEMAVAIVSENDWITIARGATRGQGGSSMRQFVTRDGGKTWAISAGRTPTGAAAMSAPRCRRCAVAPDRLWSGSTWRGRHAPRHHPRPTVSSCASLRPRLLSRAPRSGAPRASSAMSGASPIARAIPASP